MRWKALSNQMCKYFHFIFASNIENETFFPWYSIKVTESKEELIITSGQGKAVIHANPFRIDFYRNNVLYVQANAKGLFKFEHYRNKPANEWVESI